MSFTTRNLKSPITVWTVASKDVYGKPTYSISYAKGRWELKQEKTVDSQGNDIISNAVVFLDKDVAVGSYLFEGTSVATSPVSGSREVKNFSKIPSINGRLYERKAILK